MGVDKSTDQTAIIGDLIGDKYFRLLSPIIAVYNFIIKMKFEMAIIGDNKATKAKKFIIPNYRRFKFHNRIETSNGDNCSL